MLLGAHLSIAGGLENALLKAKEYGFHTLALFLRNQRQWRAGPLTDQTAERFRSLRKKLVPGPLVAHGLYLLNLAAEGEVREKSIAAMIDDMDRCRRLGVDFLVIHPGSWSDANEGMRRIAQGLNEIVVALAEKGGRTILLETTSGSGFSIGGRFEELAGILSLLDQPRRFGVCMDTCHIFAAGYDIRSPEAYAETMARFDATIGLPRLKAVHVNDSKGKLGSHLDRHEHIGKGKIGLEGFANFVRDRRLAKVPLILETPKGEDSRGRDWDGLNAQALRRLQKRAKR